ncbi:MAG: hypothetical protein KDD53_10550, partial [Bdellovibrionales bacterium]|nr:hypothetical protein [Bdellovibrionales bacterium]
THRKATSSNQVGSPLQGRLSEILVKSGDSVEKDAPLFVIEAMKMETTVVSPRAGKISDVSLEAGTMVQTDDLVVAFAE